MALGKSEMAVEFESIGGKRQKLPTGSFPTTGGDENVRKFSQR
jgi:hypothetical protein